jgi:tryprostatin B 6-hydroxylase
VLPFAQEHKDDRTNIIGYVIKDAMEHGGIKKNWNWILGDFVLVVAAGR